MSFLDWLIAFLLLILLPVAPEHEEGYQRSAFPRQDVRPAVLEAEQVDGQWVSIYDGLIGPAADFDIDHFVPLREAWESGAWAWSRAQRRAFANDLSHPDTLIAVSARSNRSKGARDPAEWLPPDPTVHCWYAQTWVGVKARWRLHVDQAERLALQRTLLACRAGAN